MSLIDREKLLEALKPLSFTVEFDSNVKAIFTHDIVNAITNAPSIEEVEPAINQFNSLGGNEEPEPIERLRFFCSLAMKNKDWLDVEPFFYDVIKQLNAPDAVKREEPLQSRIKPWLLACFGEAISNDKLERGDRLLEESLELLQSGNYPKERIYGLIEYTYSRPKGEPSQEVGGVMITLGAYCLAHNIDMHKAGETELARIWTKVEQIREKQKNKPTGSALPIAAPSDKE